MKENERKWKKMKDCRLDYLAERLATRLYIESWQVGVTSAERRSLVALCHSRHRGRVELTFLLKDLQSISDETSMATTLIQYWFSRRQSSAAVASVLSVIVTNMRQASGWDTASEDQASLLPREIERGHSGRWTGSHVAVSWGGADVCYRALDEATDVSVTHVHVCCCQWFCFSPFGDLRADRKRRKDGQLEETRRQVDFWAASLTVSERSWGCRQDHCRWVQTDRRGGIFQLLSHSKNFLSAVPLGAYTAQRQDDYRACERAWFLSWRRSKAYHPLGKPLLDDHPDQ